VTPYRLALSSQIVDARLPQFRILVRDIVLQSSFDNTALIKVGVFDNFTMKFAKVPLSPIFDCVISRY